MREIMFFGIGLWLGMQLSKQSAGATPPPPITTKPKLDQPQQELATVGGYFPSYLNNARPQHPYQVRWGSGNNYYDTTKKAQLVI